MAFPTGVLVGLLFVFALPFLQWAVNIVLFELLFPPKTPRPHHPDPELGPLLRHKVVLVTGASQGIGRELACLYAGHGCKVVIASRNVGKLEEVKRTMVDEWGAKESDVLVVGYDGSKPLGTVSTDLVTRTVSHFGHLDILVLNHIKSIYSPLFPPDLHPSTASAKDASRKMLEEHEEVTRTNYLAYVELALAALPHLRESTLRHAKEPGNFVAQIIVASSASAGMPSTNIHSYAASKAAVNQWFQGLRAELKCNPYYNGLVKVDIGILGAIDSEGFRSTPLVNNKTVMASLAGTLDAAWRLIRAGFDGRGTWYGGRGRQWYFPFFASLPGYFLSLFQFGLDPFVELLYSEDAKRGRKVIRT
ncbi:hypothetical protein DFJ74DRAFT_687702 [Hyaloraphidium curvatum]|nr:hypothetical protein DFJ74DRAFT_687702 [Hyaloraphidium curvatum]